MLTFAQLEKASTVGGTVYDPNRHVIIPTNDWLTSVVNQAKVNGVRGWDRLFLYHHEIADTFVLAMWQTRPDEPGVPVMLELMVLIGPPGHSTYRGMKLGPAPDIERVLLRLAPASKHAEAFRAKESAERDAELAKRGEDMEARERVARDIGKHNESAARAIRSGMIPVAAGDDQDDEILRKLPTGRKHSVVIDGGKSR